MDKDNDIDRVKRKELIDSIDIDRCDHEMDPATERYDHKRGRVGYCLKCEKKVYFTKFITNPKRERAKMKKKQRRKLNKENKK